MKNVYKDLLIITASALILAFLMWLPYWLKIGNLYNLDFSAGFNTIYRNFDGLEYIVIAKSFYIPSTIASLPQSQPSIYYASHFPGYALLILLFSPLLGFLKSMLFVTILSTIASAVAFYFLVKDFKLTYQPLWLTLLFLVLPARWLIVHSVGSAEPLFIFFTIMALYFFLKFEQKGHWAYIHLTGFFGLLAQLTRPPGILLFVGLLAYIVWKIFQDKGTGIFSRVTNSIIRYHPLIVIPLALLAIFYWYSKSYGDFFAYFHSGDNIHLTFPPFQVFNKHQYWVGEIWLEDIIYIFLLGFLGVTYLFKQKLYPLFFFTLTYLLATTLVAHRDVSRYILPIFPFLLIAFEKVLVSKEFKIAVVVMLLAIYLYVQNFIIQNIAPFPNLQYFN